MIESNIHIVIYNILREGFLEKISFKRGTGEGIRDVEKTSYIICRAQSKGKIQVPLFQKVLRFLRR